MRNLRRANTNRYVTILIDATVNQSDTDCILLGIRFIRQMNAEANLNPPSLILTDDNLEAICMPLDFSASSHIDERSA